LSTGKGTWTEVKKLIDCSDWDKVILITNDFGKEKFIHSKAEFVVMNWNVSLDEQIMVIKDSLKGIMDTEVALNLTSGTGEEHMTIISAVIKSGLGFRLVTVKENNLIEV
jgi:hypothetical protein